MKSIRDIMTRDPSVCTPDSKLDQIAKLMVDRDCGEIPVVNNLQERIPVGVITDRDITCRSLGTGKNPFDMKAQDCMSTPVVTISLDEPLEEALRSMVFNKIRRIPVVDSTGRCCGMLSQADVAGNVEHSLVGEVVSYLSTPSEAASEVKH